MWVVAMIAVFVAGYILDLVFRLLEKLLDRRRHAI